MVLRLKRRNVWTMQTHNLIPLLFIVLNGYKSEAVKCPLLEVTNADYANCNGIYMLTNITVAWALNAAVYQVIRYDRQQGMIGNR